MPHLPLNCQCLPHEKTLKCFFCLSPYLKLMLSSTFPIIDIFPRGTLDLLYTTVQQKKKGISLFARWPKQRAANCLALGKCGYDLDNNSCFFNYF